MIYANIDASGKLLQMQHLPDSSSAPSWATNSFPDTDTDAASALTDITRYSYVNSAWVYTAPTDAELFSQAQQTQLAALEAGMIATLQGGFTAKTLVGTSTTPHQYPTDAGAQSNFTAGVTAFTTNPNKTSITIQTLDAGWVSHTKTEFYGVYSDGDNWKEAQFPKLTQLQSQVNALQLSSYSTLADALAAVQAVVWTPATP